MKRFTIRLSDYVYERLNMIASLEKRSKNKTIEIACEKLIKSYQKKLVVKEDK